MNIRPRISLVGGFLLIILSALFPPYLVQVQILRETSEPIASYYEAGGPRFLFAFPKPELTEKGPWAGGQQLDASEATRKAMVGFIFCVRGALITGDCYLSG